MADEKSLDVIDSRRGPYRRVIRTRPVTYVCVECGKTVTEDLYPGGAPRYCDACVQKVRRRHNADRQRRYRARQKAGM